MRKVVEQIATAFDLTDEELRETNSNGKTSKLTNRVHWAATYLVQAGLLVRPKRAHIRATELGCEVYQNYQDRIDNLVLEQFSEFRDFKQRSRTSLKMRESDAIAAGGEGDVSANQVTETPEELIELAAEELNSALRNDLLSRIVDAAPEFFEQLIIDLMLAMGYGGSGSSKHLGKTADGGVDGVINEDPLGLDVVFLQAKRYAPGNTISVNQIREFAGSLDERGATKGVFVTTSSFAKPAHAYAERSPKRLILIDGLELSRLMVQYGVGVRSFRVVDLKKVDEDYFPIAD